MKLRRWIVLQVNCDCCSYTWARNRLRPGYFPKCRHCDRYLGPLDYQVLAYGVRAVSEFDAIKQARSQTP